jgi:hypothetical protein
MTDEEKVAAKAACVQAVATLIAAKHMRAGEPINPDECVKLAATLYANVATIKWEPEHAAEGPAITRGRERIFSPAR